LAGWLAAAEIEISGRQGRRCPRSGRCPENSARSGATRPSVWWRSVHFWRSNRRAGSTGCRARSAWGLPEGGAWWCRWAWFDRQGW